MKKRILSAVAIGAILVGTLAACNHNKEEAVAPTTATTVAPTTTTVAPTTTTVAPATTTTLDLSPPALPTLPTAATAN